MVTARVNAERLVLLGWSRAILLQLAHPLVAAGVADHSSFRQGRITAAVRLHHTVKAMLSLTFGGGVERDAALAGINGIHRRVKGALRRGVGPFAAGTRYSAEDPSLLLWVHGTLLESIPMVYERLVAPLSIDERDGYCREAAAVVRALGARDDVPQSWGALEAYMARMYAGGTVVVGEDARSLAPAVLAPPLAWLVAPAVRVNRLFAIGLLPPVIRTQYGFGWSAGDEAGLERWTRILRRARQYAPERAALWPEARRAACTGSSG